MADKATILIGEPCVGKSTIMRALLRRAPFAFVKMPHTPHHHSAELRLSVLGRYDDEQHQFPGTDRLSMSVQTTAINWCVDQMYAGLDVALEGDRLGNGKFIRALSLHGMRVRIGVVTALPLELKARRALERTQSPEMIRARQTKVQNIRKAFADMVTDLPHSTPSQTEAAVDWILA